MLRFAARLPFFFLIAGLSSACWVGGFGVARVVSITAGPPGGPSTPVVPAIHLEYGGSSVPGVQTTYSWHTANAGVTGGSGSAGWPPQQAPALTVPAGQSVDIVVAYHPPPAALWIAELDPQGVPATATAVRPTSNVIPYSVVSSGPHVLQVHAQWTHENYVTYLFSLHVTP